MRVFGVPQAKNEDTFGRRYGYRPNPFSPRGFDYNGARNLDELKDILAPFYLARKREAVLADMPTLWRRTLCLGAKVAKSVSSPVDTSAIRAYAKEGVMPPPQVVAMEVLSEYRKAVGVAKAVAFLEWWWEQSPDISDRVVVFCHHKEVANLLAMGLGAGDQCMAPWWPR
jgi:hypothetical protein